MDGSKWRGTALFIDGTRSGYSPSQIDHQTLTIGQLIEILNDYANEAPEGEDTKVFLSNDRGYTYGHINRYTILGLAEYDSDGDVEYIEE